MRVNILESFKKAQKGFPDDLTEKDEALMASPLTDEMVDEMGKEDEYKRNAKRLGEISQEILARIVPEGTEPTSAMRERAVKQAMEQLHKENNPKYQYTFTIGKTDDEMDGNIINKSTSQLMAERYAQGVPTGAFCKNINAARFALEVGDIPGKSINDISKETEESENNLRNKKKDDDPSEPPMKALSRQVNIYNPAIRWAMNKIDNSPKEFDNIKLGDKGYIDLIKKLAKQYQEPQKQLQRVRWI